MQTEQSKVFLINVKFYMTEYFLARCYMPVFDLHVSLEYSFGPESLIVTGNVPFCTPDEFGISDRNFCLHEQNIPKISKILKQFNKQS